MTTIISLPTNKGGVGKTTLTTNLASALSILKSEKQILIIDGDPQGNSSISFGINPNKIEKTIYNIIMEDYPASNAIIRELKGKKNLHLLPSKRDLGILSFKVLTNLKKYPNPFGLFDNVVKKLDGEFDYIFIDSPPNLELLAANILMVSDEAYIPFEPEPYGVHGIIQIIETIKEFQDQQKAKIKVGGVFGSKIDRRKKLHSNLLIQADAYCQKNNIRFLRNRIYTASLFSNAIGDFGMPATLALKNHPAVQNCFDLVKEMIGED